MNPATTSPQSARKRIAAKLRQYFWIASFIGRPPPWPERRGTGSGAPRARSPRRRRRGGPHRTVGRAVGRAVDVGDRLAVAGLLGAVGRAAAREGRPRAQRLARRVAEELVGGVQPDGLRAAAGLEAHVEAVAVEVLALAGDADHRVTELLVVLDARAEVSVLDLDVARREH